MATPEEVQASINQMQADIAQLRQSRAGYMAGFPKWAIVGIALWVAVIETADKLPQLMLTYPRYEASLAEAKGKVVQLELLTAQLATAQNEAKASAFKPDTAAAQLTVAQNEAKAAPFKPGLSEAQLTIAQNDARAAVYKQQLAEVTLAKTTAEAQATALQVKLNALQLAKLGIDIKTAAYQQVLTASQSTQALQNAAMTQAGNAIMLPMLTEMLKKYGIDLKADELAPMMDLINPTARTQDLTASLPNGPRPPPTSVIPPNEDFNLGVSLQRQWLAMLKNAENNPAAMHGLMVGAVADDPKFGPKVCERITPPPKDPSMDMRTAREWCDRWAAIKLATLAKVRNRSQFDKGGSSVH